MTDITTEIQDAIKRSLPQHVGEALKKELDALESLRKDYVTQERMYTKLQARNTEIELQIDKLIAEMRHHTDLRVREAAVLKREQEQNFNDFQTKLYGERHAEMLGLVGMVFKSPVYREHINGSVPVSVGGTPASQYSPGYAGYATSSPIDTTTTTSIE